MTQANIDQLLQLTAARVTRPGDNARPSSRPQSFNDLFQLVSTSAPETVGSVPGSTSDSEHERRTSNVSASYETAHATQQPSHSGPDTEADRRDEGDETSSLSTAENEDSNRGDEAVDSEQPARAADDSDDHDDDEDRTADGAVPSISAATGAVADGHSAGKAAAAAAIEGEQVAENADATKSPKELVAGKPNAHEHAEKLLLKEAAATLPEVAEVDARAADTDQAKKSPASRGRKHPGANGSPHGVAARSAVQGEHVQKTSQAAEGSTLSPQEQAALSIAAAGKADDAVKETEHADEATTSGDEASRRAAAPARTGSRVDANGIVAVPTAAPGSVDSTAPAGTESPRRAASGSHAKPEALANVLGRNPPGSGSAHRARRSAGDDELPRIDPARFIGRVAKAFQTAEERGGALQLRLSPPELGALRLELTVKDGVMTAALETETASARRLLLDHLPALRERLAEQNIRVERFDVDVRRDGGQSSDGRTAHQQQHNASSDQPPPRREASAAPRMGKTAAPQPSLAVHVASDGRINLVA
jgi:flagellar hook-length control protein FliK